MTSVAGSTPSTSPLPPNHGSTSSLAGPASAPTNDLEAMDKECSALGGLFQQIINDMKNGVPHYEEFVTKASKLHSQLKTTVLVLSSFLDTFQKIADAATNTKGATREIGSCLTRIVIRHKALESRMKTLCSALLDSLVNPLQGKLDDWRKDVVNLDKEHSKEYKKIRADVKKKLDNSQRVQKKHKKNKNVSDAQRAIDAATAEVTKHYRFLLDTERGAVRKALIEERSRYCTLVSCLKPFLEEEIHMVSEFQQLEEVSKKLSRHTEEPYKLPPASEQIINDLSKNSGDGNFSFKTPPSSPSASSIGSRKSSMCSISSAGSNTNLNKNHAAHSSPIHGPGTGGGGSGSNLMGAMGPGGATLRHRSLSQNNSSGNLGNQMLRLSSISSQDSGFTSQDTLFMAKNANGTSDQDLSVNNAERTDTNQQTRGGTNASPPEDDRPHTISTAYEKGPHQRPSLKPYTFHPPKQEDDQGFKKPPVPIRSGSLDSASNGVPPKPSLPSGKKPKGFQTPPSMTPGLPNFNANKEDMIVPQPVYMNMSDLANMAAQKAQFQQQQQQLHQAFHHQNLHPTIEEESAELKTPVAEELNMIPGASRAPGPSNAGDGGSSTSDSSVGSSSGYGSQSTVRLEEQQQLRQQQEQMQQNLNQSLTEVNAMPTPQALMIDTVVTNKYRSLPRQQPHNNFVHNFEPTSISSSRQTQQQNRPLSFTQAEPIPEMSNIKLGSNLSQQPISTLRRAHSTATASNRPVQQQQQQLYPPDYTIREDRTPPPPPPAPAPAPGGGTSSFYSGGSNSSTPRGSMEHLPPPPPHLLHSDEEHEHKTVITQRSISVAESVKALQKSGHTPCSPRSLRRAHSMAAPHSPYIQQQQQQQQQQPEQIYAPVAHLQQKIQQRQQQQQQMIHRGGGQVPLYQSPEGEQYGFGVQFQQHQSEFLQQQSSQQHDQIMGEVDPNMRNRPRPPPMMAGAGQALPVVQSNNYDAQTALRVRRWIESRSVSDVRNCRPVLNQEIQQGFALKKTSMRNDRSAPRF